MLNPLRVAALAAAIACLVPASAMAAAPAVTTGAATNVSPDAATVNGSVDPNGHVTTWYFQYGRTKNYGNRTTALDAGSGNSRVKVSAPLTGLRNKTTYHYRLVATSSDGTTRGADKTFKTPEAPTISTIAASRNPAVFGSPVVISGFLVGPRGGGGKQVALEANDFPFTAGFQQLGNTVVTAADGGYNFVIGAFATSQLRVVDRSDPSIVSPTLTHNVASKLSLHATRSKKHKSVIRFSGTAAPHGSTSAIVIQRRTKKGGWKNVKVALPHGKDGAKRDHYSRRVKARRGGRFRVYSRPANGYAEGLSKRVKVKRR
jgi:hypothetical protein